MMLPTTTLPVLHNTCGKKREREGEREGGRERGREREGERGGEGGREGRGGGIQRWSENKAARLLYINL